MSKKSQKKAVIIGAGPAGLTAASELLKTNKFDVKILEKDSIVGGLSRTTEYKGCKFDIGPHHFITESGKIEKWWLDLMKKEKEKGNEFLALRRFTRIYYKKHFFNYPLQPLNVLRGLSIFECISCILSYIKIRLFPVKNVKTFQDWVTNKFGYRLFSIFFKTYTEKLWGIECTKISSDWASQRIKGFSLSKAIFYAFFGRWFKKNAPRTLSDKFYYPKKGAGTLWQRVADNVSGYKYGQINLKEEVVSIEHKNNKIVSVATATNRHAKNLTTKILEYEGDYFFSTMPLKDLVLSLTPKAPDDVLYAAKKLLYRALITVNLIVDKKDICPDHWLYIHEKEVSLVRIGNMNNFSLKMVDSGERTALSLEYFSFTNTSIWKKSDKDLLKLGKNELEKIGLVKKDKILDGMVIREKEAYPVYDQNYKDYLNVVLDYLSQFSNLKLMGRNGLHKYNNMDIAMLSAMDAVDSVLENERKRVVVREEEKIEQVRI
jgi:protoporphyrinogen oxidase